MHRIYETSAFILSSIPRGEADRQLLLYTREFGLIWATAQGLRELKSKLRYSLQIYSRSTVSLVRGRTGWRVTNARLEQSYFSVLVGTEKNVILGRVHSLLRRLVRGQESHHALFDALREGFSFLINAPETSLQEAELLLVLCTLHHLGYLGDSAMSHMLLTSGFWNLEAISEVTRERRTLIKSVNESLRLSHL